MSAVLSVKNISRRFGSKIALDSVSFDLHTGEITGLLGLNGAGKSTCLSVLSGTLIANSGQVYLSDHPIEGHDSLSGKIGYLPEGAPLFEDLTATEHLKVMGGLQNLAGQSLVAAIQDVVTAFELDDVANRLISGLSKGYKRRVALAAAFLAKPPVLLLDEPTDGLDPIQKARMIKSLRSRTSDQALLVSTHSLSEVEALCDRVLVLQNGKLVFDDRVDAFRKTAPKHDIETAFQQLVGDEVVQT